MSQGAWPQLATAPCKRQPWEATVGSRKVGQWKAKNAVNKALAQAMACSGRRSPSISVLGEYQQLYTTLEFDNLEPEVIGWINLWSHGVCRSLLWSLEVWGSSSQLDIHSHIKPAGWWTVVLKIGRRIICTDLRPLIAPPTPTLQRIRAKVRRDEEGCYIWPKTTIWQEHRISVIYTQSVGGPNFIRQTLMGIKIHMSPNTIMK